MAAALAAHRTFLDDVLARQAARRAVVDPHHTLPPAPKRGAATPPPPGPLSKANVANYVPAEEAVRNDHAAWYGVSGESGVEYVLGARENVCEEFPTLRRLMDLKAEHVDASSHAPLVSTLAGLGAHRFDVILIHPAGWGETAALPVRQLSADPGFVFLWVGAGDGEGLERGRECLARWGFRRAEDIVHVGAAGAGRGLLAARKEHCLMGIRGTVRRSTDGRFVHCNVDTDVIVEKDHIYTLIENFCLGARRLELFGGAPRRGWVNVGGAPSDAAQQFDAATYPTLLPPRDEGKPLVPFHAEIDALRPKSPQRAGRGGGGGARVPGRGPGQAPVPVPLVPPAPSPMVMRLGPATPAYDAYGAQQLGPAFAQMAMGEDGYAYAYGAGAGAVSAGWAPPQSPWAPHMAGMPGAGVMRVPPMGVDMSMGTGGGMGMAGMGMGMGVGMGMGMPQGMMGGQQPMLGGMMLPGFAGMPLQVAPYPQWNYQQQQGYETYDDYQPGE